MQRISLRMQQIESNRLGVRADAVLLVGWQAGRVPAKGVAAAATSSCRHRGRRQVAAGPTGRMAAGPAGNGNGGTPLPALAQAARATCRLPRGAATP
jgi:hypothetical protein